MNKKILLKGAGLLILLIGVFFAVALTLQYLIGPCGNNAATGALAVSACPIEHYSWYHLGVLGLIPITIGLALFIIGWRIKK